VGIESFWFSTKKPLPAQDPGGRYKGNTHQHMVFL
jgi:hypothetical protein